MRREGKKKKRCIILFLFWQVQKEKKQTVFVRNGFVSSHCQAISGSVNLLALVRSVCACLHTTTATNVLTPLATNTVALKLYMVNSSYSENPRENAHTHTKNKRENHGQGNRSNTVLLYFTNWTCPGSGNVVPLFCVSEISFPLACHTQSVKEI